MAGGREGGLGTPPLLRVDLAHGDLSFPIKGTGLVSPRTFAAKLLSSILRKRGGGEALALPHLLLLRQKKKKKENLINNSWAGNRLNILIQDRRSMCMAPTCHGMAG